MKSLLIFFCLTTTLHSCNSNNTSSSSPSSSYQETKMSLEDKEKANPLAFLRAKGTYRQNLLNQWVLEGSVTNIATIASYKDVVLRIVYYSKTETEIGTEDKTVFEYFKPGNSQEFKIKSKGYEGTEKIGFQILSAIAVE